MSSLLPQEHRQSLQNLRWKYKEAEKVIRRKARTENFLIFVSVCGLAILGMSLFDRNAALEITGRTAAVLSVPLCILGCWTFFRRPSQIADAPERLLMNEVNDELEALGYERDFVGNAVVKKGSSVPRDVTRETSYLNTDTSLPASMLSTDTAPDLSIQEELNNRRHYVMIAKLPKTEFIEAMKLLFVEVEPNANVHQLVAYSTREAHFNLAVRLYGNHDIAVDKLLLIDEYEKIMDRQHNDLSKYPVAWRIQSLLLWHLEDRAQNDAELHDLLVLIWGNLLSTCFIFHEALKNNVIWSEDDKIFFPKNLTSNIMGTLLTIQSIAPKKVRVDPSFKLCLLEVRAKAKKH